MISDMGITPFASAIGAHPARLQPARQEQEEARQDELAGLPYAQFLWGAGIECSFLPHLNVDQFQWTQHDRFWRDDFKRAREELGITNLRYAFPWHVLEPEAGKFDFSYSDQRMEQLQKLRIHVPLHPHHLRFGKR